MRLSERVFPLPVLGLAVGIVQLTLHAVRRRWRDARRLAPQRLRNQAVCQATPSESKSAPIRVKVREAIESSGFTLSRAATAFALVHPAVVIRLSIDAGSMPSRKPPGPAASGQPREAAAPPRRS